MTAKHEITWVFALASAGRRNDGKGSNLLGLQHQHGGRPRSLPERRITPWKGAVRYRMFLPMRCTEKSIAATAPSCETA